MRSYFSKRVAAAPAKPAREQGVDASGGYSKYAVANELRRQIFGRLFETIENEGAEGLSDDTEIREYIDELIHDARQSGRADFTAAQWQDLRREVLDEIQGLGPLAPLMADPDVSDILVNGPQDIWVDKAGRLEQVDVSFDNEHHLRRLLDRLVASQGRHLDASSPYVDARLNDGSRLHAIVPPLSAKGPIVSIRRFRMRPFKEEELLAQGFLTPSALELLKLAVEGRCSVVIAGGAAAGKTTFLNFLSRYIPAGERVVTIEETAELRLEHAHVVALETRAPNIEGRGGIGLRDLLKTALRMRADRIIVGEVRGEETLDMLQAMNVGHDGSLTTVHASSAGDVLHRLEALASIGSTGIPREVVRSMVASAIDLIVYVTRFRDGQRALTAIHEVHRMKDDVCTRELFRSDGVAPPPEGSAGGEDMFVRYPLFVNKVAARGYAVPAHFFPPPAEAEVP